MRQQNETPLPFPDLDLIFVEGGTFTMGDNNSKYGYEKPEHPVKVSSFYIGKYPVTQRLWQAITGENPSKFKGENRPVEMVSWNNTQDFIKKIKKETGRKFRLPTEAEWEFAARGGIYPQGYDYCGSDKLKQVGWHNENSNDETHDVGLLLANELGLYDMSGNVWEWCEDWFNKKFYEKCKNLGVVENPVNTEQGVYRVNRGGGYFNDAVYCRPSSRGYWPLDDRLSRVGFRLVVPSQSVG